MPDNFDDAITILTDAMATLGRHGITKQELLPNLVDFTAMVAIALGGEDAVKACIMRLGDRINDFHAGKFPVQR